VEFQMVVGVGQKVVDLPVISVLVALDVEKRK
jgi:hypothetical protein